MTTYVLHNQKAHYHFHIGSPIGVMVEEHVRKGQKGYDRCAILTYKGAREFWSNLKGGK